MTHEEIEKVAVELGNALSYEYYTVGCGAPAIKEAIQILTTYRTQVLEEVFNAKLAERVRVPSLIPGKITTWEVVSVEELEHPTN